MADPSANCWSSASEAAAAINLAMKRIKERFDLPDSIELQADNGPEFKQSFANSLDDSAITVTHGPKTEM